MLGMKSRIAHPVISVVTGDIYMHSNISVGLRGLEKLKVSQLVKKFSKFSGTWNIACNLRATLYTFEELCL
jgi:hypothetical protein